MSSVRGDGDPLPRFFRSRQRVTFLVVATVSTLIAVVWALSDSGYVGGYWGKLALIFFTWLAVVLAAGALLRVKE